MGLTKPPKIEGDAFKSAKWDELTEGRSFEQSDAPALALLCQWYAVVERCMEDMDNGDELPQVAYGNDMGDIKALPQHATMKQASAEIRALNKQLGIPCRPGELGQIEHRLQGERMEGFVGASRSRGERNRGPGEGGVGDRPRHLRPLVGGEEPGRAEGRA